MNIELLKQQIIENGMKCTITDKGSVYDGWFINAANLTDEALDWFNEVNHGLDENLVHLLLVRESDNALIFIKNAYPTSVSSTPLKNPMEVDTTFECHKALKWGSGVLETSTASDSSKDRDRYDINFRCFNPLSVNYNSPVMNMISTWTKYLNGEEK